jgi:hypothetical protein
MVHFRHPHEPTRVFQGMDRYSIPPELEAFTVDEMRMLLLWVTTKSPEASQRVKEFASGRDDMSVICWIQSELVSRLYKNKLSERA